MNPMNLLELASVEVGDERAGVGTLETARGRLPLVALDVKTRIVGLSAETQVRQTFRNSLDEPLEATYIFPLPERAAVISGVSPLAGAALGFAPAFRSLSTIARLPFVHARVSGVTP